MNYCIFSLAVHHFPLAERMLSYRYSAIMALLDQEPATLTGLATSEQEISELDTRGLRCPLPLLKAKRALAELESGAMLRVFATDRGSVRDFKVYAELSGHRLISSVEEDDVFIHVLEKK